MQDLLLEASIIGCPPTVGSGLAPKVDIRGHQLENLIAQGNKQSDLGSIGYIEWFKKEKYFSRRQQVPHKKRVSWGVGGVLWVNTMSGPNNFLPVSNHLKVTMVYEYKSSVLYCMIKVIGSHWRCAGSNTTTPFHWLCTAYFIHHLKALLIVLKHNLTSFCLVCPGLDFALQA